MRYDEDVLLQFVVIVCFLQAMAAEYISSSDSLMGRWQVHYYIASMRYRGIFVCVDTP